MDIGIMVQKKVLFCQCCAIMGARYEQTETVSVSFHRRPLSYKQTKLHSRMALIAMALNRNAPLVIIAVQLSKFFPRIWGIK